MDDNVSSPPETNIRKRPASDEDPDQVDCQKPLNLKGNQFIMPTPPDTEESSNASPAASHNPDDMDRAASPAPSSVLSSVAEVTIASSSTTALPSSLGTTAPTSTSGPPPAKRRKLTPSEKLDALRIKEAKAREKAEEKARKEEEKARKDEEKARKDEEKARLQVLKDEEKRIKDEEKRQKAEEKEAKKREKELEDQRKAQSKLDKERSQMRLSGFFQPKPATPAKNNGTESQPGIARRKSLSLEPYDAAAEKIKISASPARGTPPPGSQKKAIASRPSALSDYQRTFLSFVPPTNSTLAPLPEASAAAQDRFDHELADPSLREKYDLGLTDSYAGIDHYFATAPGVTRGEPVRSIKEIVGVIDGTVKQPIDLTGAEVGNTALDHLRRAAVRHIEFQQDVRPAYYGTYTKITSPRKLNKFRRNPFLRARPDTDYDNDSEAEWEEPEEGDEEILSEAEDEADSQGDANEIDDFLDDEDDTARNRRKVATGELVPETTGLCWENESHRMCVVKSIETDTQPPAMHGMRIGVLLPDFTGTSIDPFSAAYWQDTTVQPTGGSMLPPRAPLQPRINSSENGLIGASEGQRGPITTIAASQNQGAKRGPKPAPRTLSKEDLAEFKEAVVGCPLGKLELQKALKTRFPKLTNDAIKETLGTQFAQKTGLSKADKKWVYVGDS